ncbi:squalene/phytoene synthase family protein [Nocardia grenadensis]|uniref:squalene/phytoene synthase family protein n=1 Tax=Nocardia grenadensis TaxID=931537 RepID=UPI003D75A8E1
MTDLNSALDEVRRWSTTYHRPLSQMPPGLQEAKVSFYLLFRGIDEIEDHPELDASVKEMLLTDVACALQTRNIDGRLRIAFADHHDALPEVSLRLADWCELAPAFIAPRIVDAAIAMANRMAVWSTKEWRLHDVDDLDHYTFSVAGVVATLLCDMWAWHDGTQVDRSQMMSYARGVQAANILAGLAVDRERGIDFLPDGWAVTDLMSYAGTELALADRMVAALPTPGPAHTWCSRAMEVARAQLDHARAIQRS